MELVDHGIRSRSGCRNRHLPKRKRGARRGGRQRGLTAKRHSYCPCLFIFAVPPKWDGRFFRGSWHIWALSPGLWGVSQQTLSHCCDAVNSLSTAMWCMWIDHVPSSTEFPTLEKGHPCLVPVSSHLFRGNKVTLLQPCLWRKIKS